MFVMETRVIKSVCGPFEGFVIISSHYNHYANYILLKDVSIF